jgi:flagellar basal body-associated protein FliL
MARGDSEQRNKRKDKRGRRNRIIILLGVVVLVVLILGFTMGWISISGLIIIQTSNNVQTILDSCSAACETSSAFSYCTIKRKIKLDESELSRINTDLVNVDRYLKLKDRKSCNELLKYPKFGIKDCSGICSVNN